MSISAVLWDDRSILKDRAPIPILPFIAFRWLCLIVNLPDGKKTKIVVASRSKRWGGGIVWPIEVCDWMHNHVIIEKVTVRLIRLVY